jgi:hypothetical protein
MDPYRTDDCFVAAVATCTQVPVEEVPDPDLDKRVKQGADPEELNELAWERYERWAARRGLRMRFWEDVPVPRDRWIGVVVVDPAVLGRAEDEKTVDNHSLVTSHDRLLFDPMC